MGRNISERNRKKDAEIKMQERNTMKIENIKTVLTISPFSKVRPSGYETNNIIVKNFQGSNHPPGMQHKTIRVCNVWKMER